MTPFSHFSVLSNIWTKDATGARRLLQRIHAPPPSHSSDTVGTVGAGAGACTQSHAALAASDRGLVGALVAGTTASAAGGAQWKSDLLISTAGVVEATDAAASTRAPPADGRGAWPNRDEWARRASMR